MASGEAPDPIRATFVAILQQLNRAESIHEGKLHEQALYLDELERALRRFWAVDEARVKVPFALGLLVRNGLVRAEVAGGTPPHRQATGRALYRITSEGKQFLVEALEKADRIA
ncbi:MAG TPA: hypothetical protein VEH10_06645 [Thermoplasmata archaeon]|nr:hypothetical protein [Thermoplasmata archaeon]